MATWNPWQQMERVRRDIDHAFEQAGWQTNGHNGHHGHNGRTFQTAFLPGHAARAYPLVNVNEDAQALYVTALAPGLDPAAVQVTVQDNRLTIAGEKQRLSTDIQPEALHRSERAAGTFVRTVTLPVEVEQEHVQADYKHGLLTVTLPKAEKAKPTQITVSLGA
jgi:HSP20 family protein